MNARTILARSILARSRLAVLALALVLASSLEAVSTKSFDFVAFKDFETAELAGVKVSTDGELSLGLDAVPLKAGEKEIWSALVARDGTTWFTTGNGAALYRIPPKAAKPDTKNVTPDAPEKVHGADEVALSCLAEGPDGKIYAGSLPAGRIYVSDGTATKLFCTLPAPYIWALAFDREGHLFAGTGPEGVIYRISPTGEAKIHYDARDGNILSLALGPDGDLYAGSATKGLLYRVKKAGAAEVVWDFKGREVKAMTFHGRRLFLAVNEVQGRLASPGAKDGGKTALEFSSLARKLTGRFSGSEVSQEGAELSSDSSLIKRYESGHNATVFELTPESRVETVWELAESSILDLEVDAQGALYVATGKGGRVYGVVPRGVAHLLLTRDEAQAACLAMHQGRLAFVGCANPGTALAIGPGTPASGRLTSKPLDAGFPSRFGQARWEGAGAVTVSTRSGNTATPDPTWSDWSAPIGPLIAPIASPAGRYLQLRIDLTGPGASKLFALRLFYLNQNQTPRVEAVLVGPGKLPEKADKEQPQDFKKFTEALSSLAGGSKAKEKQEEERADKTTQAPPAFEKPASPVKEVRWSAADEDGDTLVYRLYVREAGDDAWVTLTPKEPLDGTSHSWNTDAVPDGRYVLKVVASDERSNPSGEGLAAEKSTVPFVVDNTRPLVVLKESGPGQLGIRVTDELSPVIRAEVSVDGQEWKLLHPTDRVSDGLTEAFELALPAAGTGPHAIAVRAADSEGNVGAARLLVRARKE